MASVIKSVTFDSTDVLSLARFWATALGTDVDEDATADRAYVEAPGWGGPNMWFVRVPEPQNCEEPNALRPAGAAHHGQRGRATAGSGSDRRRTI